MLRCNSLRFTALFAGCCWVMIAITTAASAQLKPSSDTGGDLVDQRTAKEVSKTMGKPIARVFILAGQSNMVGHGVVDLDDQRDYNGGRGTLARLLEQPATGDLMRHLLAPGNGGDDSDSSQRWRVRDDVHVYFQAGDQLKTGGLSVGFTNYAGQHHFGPELQFGHVVGDAFDCPILIIKTAWGGKSLQVDFRPPSSGGEVGEYYIKMLEEIGSAIETAEQTFPALAGHELVVSGFVWQQGWNDMISDDATSNYEQNLTNFIGDICKQVGVPHLPFVYGELGNGGPAKGEKMARFRAAQRAVAEKRLHNVAFVETNGFARPAQESPNTTHLHHWFGNAESYFLVGDALGRKMVNLVRDQGKNPKVLILGDSISMGYTPFVREMLAQEATVVRPMRNAKQPENCCGTDLAMTELDRWLALAGGDWDVIHFNFGLHDLKHVNAAGKNSNKPTDPYQSDLAEYEIQLRAIMKRLSETEAKLIFATTTPVPVGCQPLREPETPPKYNEVALRLAQEFDVEVNDLFAFASQRASEIQRPKDVHFTRAGSRALAIPVAAAIRSAIAKKP